MTNPSPERDKVEELFIPYSEELRRQIAELKSLLSLSEKRAESLEFKLADDGYWKLRAEQAESSLARVVEALERVWAQCNQIALTDDLIQQVRSALHNSQED